jgi:nicotinamidase-related amidase
MPVNRIFNREEFINNLNSVINLARRANIPIFCTRIQMLPKDLKLSARLYTLTKLGFDHTSHTVIKEDLDFAIKSNQMDQQQQGGKQKSEIVIDKHTASIFIDKGFEHNRPEEDDNCRLLLTSLLETDML